MKKYVISFIMLLFIGGIFSGCGHKHTWMRATCTQPQTCSECGKTEGTALGHTWSAATCTKPKTCNVCGETEGSTLEHTWANATCTTPKTCSVCGTTEGSTLEHTWVNATCTAPKACSVCGTTEGSTLEHTWVNATCQAPKSCSACGKTEGTIGDHTLDSGARCTVCGKQVGFALNKSNYKQYLEIKGKYNQQGRDLGIDFDAEPVKNVTFYRVEVTMKLRVTMREYTQYSLKSYSEKSKNIVVIVNSSGYGQAGYFERTGYVESWTIENITGYVIE